MLGAELRGHSALSRASSRHSGEAAAEPRAEAIGLGEALESLGRRAFAPASAS